MLFLVKFLLTLSLGFNARVAKIQPNPWDYQVKSHIRTMAGELEGKYERENGELYRGLFVRTKAIQGKDSISINPLTPQFLEGIYVEIKIDEADQLNKEYVYKNFIDLDILKLRSCYQWTYWKDRKFMGGFEINFDTEHITTRYEYDTNLIDRHISRFNFEYKYFVDNVWYIMPHYSIEDHDGQKYWKCGIEWGFDFTEYRILKDGNRMSEM